MSKYNQVPDLNFYPEFMKNKKYLNVESYFFYKLCKHYVIQVTRGGACVISYDVYNKSTKGYRVTPITKKQFLHQLNTII